MLRQRQRRGIGDDIPALIRLDQHRGIEGVDVEMLDAEALGIFALILRHFLKGRQQLMLKQMIDCLALDRKSVV